MENLKPPSGKDTAPILMSGDPELVSEFQKRFDEIVGSLRHTSEG